MSVSLQTMLDRLPAGRRTGVETRAAELIAEETTLAELRKAQKLTQQKMAKLLGIRQESVSNIENRADLLLSTLQSFVRAAGGELSLRVTFPDKRVVELTTLRTAGKRGVNSVRGSAARISHRKRTTG